MNTRTRTRTRTRAVPGRSLHTGGSLWRPHSTCGPDCLPDPGQLPRASGPRQLGRLMALLGALLFGGVLLPVLPVLPRPGRGVAGRAWARTVLRAGGIRLDVRGRPPLRRALLVANHVSWLDVVTILAVTPARLLAKHEVRNWPLIGPLAALGGTIFIDRTRPRTLPQTVAEVAEVLRADGVVAVFPEGTTWCGVPRAAGSCGRAVRFRPAMFQAAVDAATPVVPVHLGYRIEFSAGRPATGAPVGPTGASTAGTAATGQVRAADTTAASFLAEESLYTSVRRVLALRNLVVTLTVVDEPWCDGPTDRRRLATAAEAAVRAAGPAGPPARSAGGETLELAA
ncbi:lysophospholipid acyltransferase family protein [Plantactinospora sp. CA-294935]|uniref:lysophospholipid acyltransferase family protein n=1 Tax=Plantactinospora sp. CA-294935 TaxID=3240012 RepID=UPI003D8A14AA